MRGPDQFVGPGSLDVKIEGKNVQFLSDPMMNNGGSSGTPANAGTMIGIIQDGLVIVVDEVCPICHKHHGKLEETQQTKADAGGLAANFEGELKKVNGKASTMLGVVKCLCGQNYADDSGATTIELCAAAAASGMKHPAGVTHSVMTRREGEIRRRESVARTRMRMEAHLKSSFAFEKAWQQAEKQAALQDDDFKSGHRLSTGACAAQKVLLLVREDGALPGAMTERWHSSRGTSTRARVAFVDVEGGERKPDAKNFEPGATVPPCKTCVILLPLLLCPGDELQCTHAT